jgi:hypothetical protein
VLLRSFLEVPALQIPNLRHLRQASPRQEIDGYSDRRSPMLVDWSVPRNAQPSPVSAVETRSF